MNRIIYFLLICILVVSCCGRVLPPGKFIFDSKFDSLYKAISSRDTIFLENDKNSIDTFILTKVDSQTVDHIDCFMSPQAGKSIFRNYKQYPVNYWADSVFESQGTDHEKTIAREIPLISITKLPDSITTAYLSFKDLYCNIEGSLGKPSGDTLIMNNHYFTNYYIFNSNVGPINVNDRSVEMVFVTLQDGIIAYKEKSGILRKRIFFW